MDSPQVGNYVTGHQVGNYFTDDNWVAQAGCRDRDPAEFTGEDLSPAALEAARAVCWSCPVARQCAGYAREIGATWGLWAGRWRTPRSPSRDQRVA